MKAFLFFLLIPIQIFAEHLYVINARYGEVSEYQLILSKIDHSVIYFTQDGEKRAGVMPLNEFLLNWEKQDDFEAQSMPGQYVSYIKSQTAYSEGPFDLIYPRYNQADETLIFTLKEKANQPGKLGETTLFLTHE